MGQFVNASDFLELFIYFAVFIGITIYSVLKSKKKNQNQNDDDIVIQDSNQNNSPMQTDWRNTRKSNKFPYQIGRNKNNNPIFGSSTNNISYTRTFMIFLAVAVFAVLLIAYFTGEFESYVNAVYQIIY